MSEAPEKIWAWPNYDNSACGSWNLYLPTEGNKSEYTRSDLVPDPDAIWNEAIEAAASTADKRATISDGVVAAKGHGGAVNYIADAHRASAAAIRALKRSANEQKERTAQALSDRLPIGTRVRKTKGSSWQGRIVGTYSTNLTPEGYLVESEREPGCVQICTRSDLEVVNEQ